MDKLETLKYLHLSRFAELWMYIALGMGLGQVITEGILYQTFGRVSPLMMLAVGYFAISLINYHVRQWAMKKVDCLDEDGREQKIKDLAGKQ